MKKLILTILTVLTALALYGCAEEEIGGATNAGRIYTVNLVENTVLDADNSYFVINVDNAVEIPNTTLERNDGELDAEYEYRYNKAVQEAYAKGVQIKVEGVGLDSETLVLNQDNGTITDSSANKTLVLVKKSDATATSPASYQIQVLLHAKTAVLAKNVTVNVGHQKFLFNNFNVKPARIWKDLDENEINSVYVPEDVKNETGDVIKKGITIVSEPVNVNLYAYDSVNKKVDGPKTANNDISSLITTSSITPFTIEDYNEEQSVLKGCMANGKVKCAIIIHGYNSVSSEKELLLNLNNTLTNQTVTSTTSLLVKGTKPVEYNILPLTSMYLDVTDSAAIFDVKATTGNTITATDIKVVGTYSGSTKFQLDNTGSSLTTGKYIIKQITANHYRIFMLASEAAAAAANDTAGNLVIQVKGNNHTYKSTDLSVGKISYAYIAGNKITGNYKLGVNNPTVVDIKLNNFGPNPALYKYDSNGTSTNYTTTEIFSASYSNISNAGNVNVTNNTCTSNTTSNCSLTVEASAQITNSQPASVTLSYTDSDATGGTVNLPSTVINFYTKEDTAVTPATTVVSGE